MLIITVSGAILFSGVVLFMLVGSELNLDMLSSSLLLSVRWLFNSDSSLFFVLLMLVSISVFIWGRYYMLGTVSVGLFFISLTLFVLSMLVLVLSESVLGVFVGWEGLGVTSFLLIIFYQNWMSVGGGLLTLLTNRIGDAVLMLTLSCWLLLSSFSLLSTGSAIALGGLLLLSFTKSAQWPFSGWLPAAMAAPTPVSALVHSSTLVTAGIWLLVRFLPYSLGGVSVILVFGSVTLIMASLAAMMESDLKKVVALSTLSQLGLMLLALFLGNKAISLFHLVAHALAKANLFLVVGVVLHTSYSQQNSRELSSPSMGTLSLSFIVSILSLSGIGFLSGMVSKEEILKAQISLASNVYALVLMFSVVLLTLAYCLKLYVNLVQGSGSVTTPMFSSSLSVFPSLVLSTSTVLFGSFYSGSIMAFFLGSFVIYPLIIVLSVMILTYSLAMSVKIGFYLQDILMKSVSICLEGKAMTFKLSSTLLEPIYLILSLGIKGSTGVSVLTLLTVALAMWVSFM
uniref:NADH:ubiquinone reductase (H(+)-translocating) n=1 Tax=Longidorus vineacola TaxID=241698 RepID=A0A1P8C752_9BILA|nr:NADH dehydrogenase subunit 5 [Longidorus vineacola]AOT84237.1 NADH dehydrogenase subunit 5 [Longidorus vineacola]